MRRVLVLCVGLLALAACQKKSETAAVGDTPSAAATAPAASLGPPKRKPGLWTQTVSSGGMTQTMKLCLDEATEAMIATIMRSRSARTSSRSRRANRGCNSLAVP